MYSAMDFRFGKASNSPHSVLSSSTKDIKIYSHVTYCSVTHTKYSLKQFTLAQTYGSDDNWGIKSEVSDLLPI